MIGPAIICDHEGCDAFKLLARPDDFDLSVLREPTMVTVDTGWLDHPDGWRVGIARDAKDYCPLHAADAAEGEPSELELSLPDDCPLRYLLAGLPAWARRHEQLRAVVEQIHDVTTPGLLRARIISTLKHLDELKAMSEAASTVSRETPERDAG